MKCKSCNFEKDKSSFPLCSTLCKMCHRAKYYPKKYFIQKPTKVQFDLTKEQINKIIQLRKQNYSYQEISKSLQISPHAACSVIRKSNKNRSNKLQAGLLKKEIENIIELRN